MLCLLSIHRMWELKEENQSVSHPTPPHTHTPTQLRIHIYELLIALCAPIRPVNVLVQYCHAVGVCLAHNRRPMWRRQAHILR